MKNVMFALLFSVPALASDDCQGIQQVLSCRTNYYLANAKDAMPGAQVAEATAKFQPHFGESSEYDSCVASVKITDARYDFNFEAYYTDDGQILMLNVGQGNVSFPTYTSYKNQPISSKVHLNKGLAGIGDQAGYDVVEATLTCELK